MVSAKTNGVSEEGMIVRNKDGSIRKTLGRKSLRPSHENSARCSVSEGNVSQSSTTNFEVKKCGSSVKISTQKYSRGGSGKRGGKSVGGRPSGKDSSKRDRCFGRKTSDQ